MSNVLWVLRRIETGARVSFAVDYYGREKVHLKRWWQPWPQKVELAHDEIRQVKRALWQRSQSRARNSA